MLELYKNIKKRRKELGITQEELAKKVGYTSTSAIAKVEAGKSDLPQSKIVAFAIALDTTPGALMGWNKDTPRKEVEDTLTAIVSEKLKQLDADGQQAVLDFIEFTASKLKRKEK